VLTLSSSFYTLYVPIYPPGYHYRPEFLTSVDIVNVPQAINQFNNNAANNINLPLTLMTLGLSFASQNVRSMNISTKNSITTQKVVSVCSLRKDFIFLSDMRLNTVRQYSAIKDLEKQFNFNGYTLLYNSPNSQRGVGILIKKNVWESITILEKFESEDGNILILQIRIKETVFVIGSIYGPNRDNEPEFYTILLNKLKTYRCPLILGGDWNATYDNSDVENNLDVVNMRNIPSLIRTTRIRNMCTELNLVEPYRTMYPNRQEYTFIPSGIQDQNRSRLDFFLISKNIYGTGTVAKIPHSLQTTLFDHKPIFLDINKAKLHRRDIIKDAILTHEDLPSFVRAAVFECYLQHYIPSNNFHNDPTRPNQFIVDEHLANIGRVMVLLNDIKNLEITTAVEGFNLRRDLEVSGKRAEINLIFDDMPNLSYFENLRIETTPEFFFQALTNCIKNNVLSHQSTIFKLKRENKTRLEKRISNLKKNFNENTGEILGLERNLSNIYEQELRDELQHYSKFEILNNEKITRHFMDLVKASKNEASINEIKRDDGSEFISENERNDYIQKYFADIYKQPANRSKNSSIEDILNFLGPLQENEIITGAKLTNEERDSLEGQITMEEITQSINESNMASAPGADGISNKFIQKFWEFFKVPFLKLTQYCFENNILPTFFKSANIKLIPKKGDPSKIKN